MLQKDDCSLENWERSTLTSKKAGFVPLFANRFYIMTVLWRLFLLYFKAASWKSCINRSAWRIVGILEVWPAVTHNTGVNVQEHGFQQNQNSSVSWTAIKFLQMKNNKTSHYAIMGRKPNSVPNYAWLIWVSGAHFFFLFYKSAKLSLTLTQLFGADGWKTGWHIMLLSRKTDVKEQ